MKHFENRQNNLEAKEINQCLRFSLISNKENSFILLTALLNLICLTTQLSLLSLKAIKIGVE